MATQCLHAHHYYTLRSIQSITRIFVCTRNRRYSELIIIFCCCCSRMAINVNTEIFFVATAKRFFFLIFFLLRQTFARRGGRRRTSRTVANTCDAQQFKCNSETNWPFAWIIYFFTKKANCKQHRRMRREFRMLWMQRRSLRSTRQSRLNASEDA